jgi:CheY-like chemotaxis protein
MSKPSIICIVDDDDVYQFTITRTLEIQKAAEKILTFPDGEMAFQFIVDHLNQPSLLPDVIFLDINMPVMDGWQFLEAFDKIKSSIDKKIIIYLVTSSIDPTDVDRAKSISSITKYLTKPIQPEALRGLIEYHTN